MTRGAFSEHTLRALELAGWSPERNVPTEHFEHGLSTEGYEVSPPVRAFLRSFGGIRLEYPHFRQPESLDHAHFDAIIAAERIFKDHAVYWSEIAKQRLCVIGEAFDGGMTLLMGPDGTVFAGRDDLLLVVGIDGADAIEALCAGHELHEVSSS